MGCFNDFNDCVDVLKKDERGGGRGLMMMRGGNDPGFV